MGSAASPDAPGCCPGHHVSFTAAAPGASGQDDEVNKVFLVGIKISKSDTRSFFYKRQSGLVTHAVFFIKDKVAS